MRRLNSPATPMLTVAVGLFLFASLRDGLEAAVGATPALATTTFFRLLSHYCFTAYCIPVWWGLYKLTHAAWRTATGGSRVASSAQPMQFVSPIPSLA